MSFFDQICNMQYEALVELASITSPKLMVRILSEEQVEGRASSKMGRLYQCLRDGREEQEVVVKVYGDGTTVKAAKYRMLKSRLKKVMLNSLLIEDTLSWDYRSYDEAYETGLQQLNLARMLIVKRAYHAVENVALSAFQKVRQYEIPAVNEGFTDILASLYLGVLRNPKAFNDFSTLHSYYLVCYYDTRNVMLKYRAWKNEVYQRKLNPSELGQQALKIVGELESYRLKYQKVSRIQMVIGTMWVNGLRLLGRFEEAIEVANSVEFALKNCYGFSFLSKQGLVLDKAYCSLSIRDFTLGSRIVKEAKLQIEEGTINGLKLSEMAVMLGLQTGRYKYARDEYEQSIKSVMQLLPNSKTKDVWRLYRVYIDLGLLIEEKKYRLTKGSDLELASGDFSSEILSFTSAKRSFNIQVLVAQVMFFLLHDEREVFVTRTEALAKYCSRYLKDNDEIRHNCFFKLLIEVEKSGFKLELRRRRIVTILERMTNPISQEISRRTNTEIIPYEVLWNLIVDHLSCTDERLRAPAAPGSN